MPDLKLRLFGPPRLERSGLNLDLERRKAEGLLAFLAVTGQRHSREALATLLWPDSDATRGRANLSRALSVLRSTLGAALLVADRESVELLPGSDFGDRSGRDLWVDVIEFEQRLAACTNHGHPASMVCAACLPELGRATNLYRDDFLAGFTIPGSEEWDSWQFYQTQELRQELCSALERLGRGYRGQGQSQTALVYVRRWVGLEPLHEPAQRQLMTLYAQSGQRSAALAQYKACRRVLETELGIQPSAETQSLHEQILAGDTGSLQPGGSQGILPGRIPAFLEAASHPARQLPLFVARKDELSRLAALLDTTLQGKGQVAFVTAQAGGGKTALLFEFAHQAQASHPQLLVASGACRSLAGVGDPYLPFRDIMAMLTGDVEALWAAGRISGQNARRLWQSVPDTARILMARGPDLIGIFVPGDGLADRAQMAAPQRPAWIDELETLIAQKRASATGLEQSLIMGQYAAVLCQLAAHRPLLLLLDDLQWTDLASAALLFHLGLGLAGSRILIVGAYRPEEVGPSAAAQSHPLEKVLAEFKRTHGDTWIDLDKANESQGRDLIAALLDREPNRLGEGFRQALFHRTAGHPLFTIELVRAMQERKNLIQDEDRYWVVGTQLDWSEMPARVEGVIEQRIGCLEPELRAILSVASVEGEQFTAGAIAHILQVDELQVLQGLNHLERRHRLVREREEVKVRAKRLQRYEFAHVLFRTYLYRSLGRGERRLLHGRIAAALERLYVPLVDQITVELAYHLLEAGDSQKAASYLLRAGDRARRLVALDEAVAHYRSAAEHWPENDQAGRAGLLLKLGESLWMYGSPQEAYQTLETGYHLFTELCDREGAGVTQRIMAEICFEEADPERWQHHAHHALALLEAGPESVELTRAISALSRMHALTGEHQESLDWGEEALEMSQRLGADDVAVHALNNVGSARASLGEIDAGLALLKQSLNQALALNLPFDAARAYFNLADQLQAWGRYSESRAVLVNYRDYGQRIHSLVTVNYALIFLSLVDWLCGQWAAAFARRPQIRRWLASPQATGYHKLFGATVLALMDNDLGRHAVARQALVGEVSVALESGVLQRGVPYLGELARANKALGLAGEASECQQKIVEWFMTVPQASQLGPLCTTYLIAGCSSEARSDSCLRLLVTSSGRMRNPVKAAILIEGQASHALARMDAGRAANGFDRAAAGWRAVGRPYDQLRALGGLVKAQAHAGKQAAALDACLQAASIVEQLASQLERADLRDLFLSSPAVQAVAPARAQPWA
jgi:DNA-binding SARP family transcriptional activator/tetratricopeptide (TPR) repeat protein